MDYVVTTRNLGKTYGRFQAVSGVNLHIRRGDIYGMIGRNGAGKTTVLRMLAGLSYPSQGEIEFMGEAYTADSQAALGGKMGFLIENPGIYGSFSAFDNLKMKCMLYGIEDENYIYHMIDLVGLRSAGNKKARTFSLGMKQRLGLAMALVGDPELVILDEPTNGLDPQGIVEMRTLIAKLNEEKQTTFIISSHALSDLEKIANCYGIIHEGHLVQELSSKEMEEASQGNLEAYYFSMTGGMTDV